MPNPPSMINLFVKNIQDKQISVRVNVTDTIETLKKQIEQKTGITPQEQRLLFGGAWIRGDHVTLDSLAVQEGNTLHLIRKVNGGFA